MKLKQYIAELNNMIEANPEILEYELITSDWCQCYEEEFYEYLPYYKLGYYKEGIFSDSEDISEKFNAVYTKG